MRSDEEIDKIAEAWTDKKELKKLELKKYQIKKLEKLLKNKK